MWNKSLLYINNLFNYCHIKIYMQMQINRKENYLLKVSFIPCYTKIQNNY